MKIPKDQYFFINPSQKCCDEHINKLNKWNENIKSIDESMNEVKNISSKIEELKIKINLLNIEMKVFEKHYNIFENKYHKVMDDYNSDLSLKEGLNLTADQLKENNKVITIRNFLMGELNNMEVDLKNNISSYQEFEIKELSLKCKIKNSKYWLDSNNSGSVINEMKTCCKGITDDNIIKIYKKNANNIKNLLIYISKTKLEKNLNEDGLEKNEIVPIFIDTNTGLITQINHDKHTVKESTENTQDEGVLRISIKQKISHQMSQLNGIGVGNIKEFSEKAKKALEATQKALSDDNWFLNGNVFSED